MRIRNSLANSIFFTGKNRLENLAQAYARDISGNFAMIFALISGVLMLSLGVAIDIGGTERNKVKAQDMLDTSVMSAARHYQLNLNKQKALEVALETFNTHCNYDWCGQSNAPEFVIEGPGNANFQVSASFEGKNKSQIMGMFGKNMLDFYNESQVGIGTSSTVHREINFVLDWSASFGIASNGAQQDQLKALTKSYVDAMPGAEDGCAFACHLPESFIKPEFAGAEVTTYDFARSNGIKLLEDEMAVAVESVVDDIFNGGSVSNKVGIYVLSDNLAQAKASTNAPFSVGTALDSVTMPRYGTRFDVALPDLAFELGKTGNGTSATDPVKAIILVTDGLNNNYDAGIQTSAFKASYCDDLKANGIKVAVLHLPYPDLNGQDWYETFAKPHISDILAGLQGCASEGLFFEASDASKIAGALGTISTSLTEEPINQLAFVK